MIRLYRWEGSPKMTPQISSIAMSRQGVNEIERRATSGGDGFTLVEVAIAIAFLGVALVTLIGIETNFVKQYSDEEKRATAALIAQYVMTMLELESDPPKLGVVEGNLPDLLNEGEYFGDAASEEEKNAFDGWTFAWKVEVLPLTDVIELPIAPVNDAPLIDRILRVEVIIRWSPFAGDEFRLTSFVPAENRAWNAKT